MINEKGAGGGYFTVPLYEKNFGSEVSGDFTLPDYYTEIRRILCVTPTVLPPAKYVGDNTAEFNGVIDYTVTYVGGDGEIYSIPLSSDYSFNLPIERIDGAEDVSALCSVGVESVNTRVSAPRRLSIRSRIRPNVRIYAKLPSDVGSEVDVAVNGIHTRASQVQSLTCQSVSSDILEVNYIHPNLSDDVRVLRADSNVLCERTEITDTGVRCFATLKLTFLISHSDGSAIETVTGEAPFDGEIDIDGGLSDAKIRVRGMVSEMSVNVTDQGIECKAGIILEGNVLGNKNVSYTDDIYSTQDTCDCEMKRISVRRCVACSSGSFSFGERFPMDTLGGNDASIYMTLGSVTMDKCEAKGDKYVLSGNALFDLLCRKDGELQMIQVIAPVRYEADGYGRCDGAITFDAFCQPMDIRTRIDGGNLCIDCEIYVCCDVVGEDTVNAVGNVCFGAPVPQAEPSIIVCYPEDGDTLWSIAKKYCIDSKRIIGDPKKDRFVMIE